MSSDKTARGRAGHQVSAPGHVPGVRPTIAALCMLIMGGAWSMTSAETAVRSAKSAPATCDRASFHLVVDVGHSAKVGGAISARGVDEYVFNLRLATQIVKALQEQGFTKTTLLVTDGPARAALAKRVERANKLAPDLFLSIHHDSVPRQFIEKWEYAGHGRGYSDRFSGHSIFVSNDNPDRAGSLLFAQLIGREMKAHGLKYTPHYVEPFMGNRRRLLVDADAGVYRYDQLIVLRMTHMPAVLLEAGSIINRDEEMELIAPERRALITESVTNAVASFCAARSKPVVATARPNVTAARTTAPIARTTATAARPHRAKATK